MKFQSGSETSIYSLGSYIPRLGSETMVVLNYSLAYAGLEFQELNHSFSSWTLVLGG